MRLGCPPDDPFLPLLLLARLLARFRLHLSSSSAPFSSAPSTQVYVMEPPMFVEGSKTGVFMTTVEPGSPFGPPL